MKEKLTTEFTTYKQALALKELGFNEPCFFAFDNCSTPMRCSDLRTNEQKFYGVNYNSSTYTSQPTYSQAFRWFREKHGLYYHIVPEFYTKGINFNWQILWYLPKEKWTKHVISDGTGLYGDNGEYPTQEKAEQACLDELIKLIKDGIRN